MFQAFQKHILRFNHLPFRNDVIMMGGEMNARVVHVTGRIVIVAVAVTVHVLHYVISAM